MSCLASSAMSLRVDFNCATWSFFSEHNFRRWTNLTSIIIVISFRLEQQAWFRVCVVPLVPITFRFIIPLTWCRCWLITSSWNLSTNVSWSSSTLWALPGYQSDSWREIPSLPSKSCDRPLYCLPSNTNLFVFCVIPWVPCYPAFDLPYLGSITISFCQECGGNFTTS